MKTFLLLDKFASALMNEHFFKIQQTILPDEDVSILLNEDLRYLLGEGFCIRIKTSDNQQKHCT